MPLTIEELLRPHSNGWFGLSPSKRDEIIEKVKKGAKLCSRHSDFKDPTDYNSIILDGVVVYTEPGY